MKLKETKRYWIESKYIKNNRFTKSLAIPSPSPNWIPQNFYTIVATKNARFYCGFFFFFFACLQAENYSDLWNCNRVKIVSRHHSQWGLSTKRDLLAVHANRRALRPNANDVARRVSTRTRGKPAAISKNRESLRNTAACLNFLLRNPGRTDILDALHSEGTKILDRLRL